MRPPPTKQVERFRRDLAALAAAPGEVAIAVSGGPDSLALLLLARAALPGLVRAATVDHGLRPESGAEAAFVEKLCRSLAVPHATLKAEVRRAGFGTQAAARQARYAALGRWMSEANLSVLLTGHHADDQAETLVMRLLRGSGVGGLAGIRAVRPLSEAGDGGLLCRPLLAWRREELAQIVRGAGLTPVADPSNEDEDYDRTHVRRHLRDAPWLDPLTLARSASALAEAEEGLAYAAARLFAERARLSEGRVVLDPDGLPAELLRRLVLHSLAAVRPESSPRGEQVSALGAHLAAGATVTLSGVKCSGGKVWRFEAAPPRRRVSSEEPPASRR